MRLVGSSGRSGRARLTRGLLVGAVAGTVAVTTAACGGSAAGQTAPAATSSAAGHAPAAASANVAMTLQLDADSGPDGWVTHKAGWPRYVAGDGTSVPTDFKGNFALPANTTVTLTIAAHDDMLSALPDGSTYNTVAGGTETVDGKTVTTIANTQIAHTITVPSLGINIPIPMAPEKGTTTVTFTFKTGAAGTYAWRCLTPCGDGTDGMGGAMATTGWMKGTFTVA